MSEVDAGSEQRVRAILCADASDTRASRGEAGRRALAESLGEIADRIGRTGGSILAQRKRSLLAEFAETTTAVRCALEIQVELERRNGERATGERLFFRIGIDSGELHGLRGSGVDVARRIERLADPGGICISGSAHDRVEGRLPLVFESLGLQSVKSVPKPVRVFRVRPS